MSQSDHFNALRLIGQSASNLVFRHPEDRRETRDRGAAARKRAHALAVYDHGESGGVALLAHQVAASRAPTALCSRGMGVRQGRSLFLLAPPGARVIVGLQIGLALRKPLFLPLRHETYPLGRPRFSRLHSIRRALIGVVDADAEAR